MNRLRAYVVTVAALTAGLTSCSEELPGGDRGSSKVPFELPLSDTTYDVEAPTWAVGDTIHVGKKQITADPKPHSYVVAEHGIYYLADQTLYFADDDGSKKIARIGYSEIVRSDDARYLGMMDAARGPIDEFDTHVAVPVVFDLDTGEQVLRPGPGRPLAGEDLAAIYEEAEIDFLGFDGNTAYANDPLRGGINRFPLDGSDPELVDEEVPGIPRLPRLEGHRGSRVIIAGFRRGEIKIPKSPLNGNTSGILSPSEDYVFVLDPVNQGTFFDADTGKQVFFDPGLDNFSLGGWLDDNTFYGATSDRAGYFGPSGRTLIVSCQTSSRECDPISDDFDLPKAWPLRPSLLFATGAYFPSY